MPELPEVETIRIGLSSKIIGSTIKNVEVLNPKSFIGNPEMLLNKKIVGLARRAKMLIIDLEGELSLIIHLKMSGQVILVESQRAKESESQRFIGGHPTKDMLGDLPNKSTRVIFTLKNSKAVIPAKAGIHSNRSRIGVRDDKLVTLYFNDQRKFGWIKLMHDEETRKLINQIFDKLGPEPLEEGFTWQILKTNLLKHKSMPVKVAILDQTIISGVGNIYACEACFNARIDPRKRVSELSDKEIEKLSQGIVKALSDGIKYGGSTRTHFVGVDGKKGLFLDYAMVYNRAGENCKICGTKIEKIKLGGRGTYLCPSCQK